MDFPIFETGASIREHDVRRARCEADIARRGERRNIARLRAAERAIAEDDLVVAGFGDGGERSEHRREG